MNIENKSADEVSMIEQNVRKAIDLLEGERQSLWTVLRASIKYQFEYWLALCYPSDVVEARLGQQSWKCQVPSDF